jgi:hypothetical protein
MIGGKWKRHGNKCVSDNPVKEFEIPEDKLNEEKLNDDLINCTILESEINEKNKKEDPKKKEMIRIANHAYEKTKMEERAKLGVNYLRY